MATLEIRCPYKSQNPNRVKDRVEGINVNEGEPRAHDFTIDSDTTVLVAEGALRALVITPGPRLLARCPTVDLLSDFLINLYQGKFDVQLASECSYSVT